MKWVVSGGKSGQESIRNGIYNLEGKCTDDDIVIIHDGIRPLVYETVLTDVFLKVQQYVNVVASLPYILVGKLYMCFRYIAYRGGFDIVTNIFWDVDLYYAPSVLLRKEHIGQK